LFVVDVPKLFAQDAVKQPRDWISDKNHQHHESFHDPHRMISNGQWMAGASSLGNNLSKHDNERRRNEQSHEAGSHVGHDDGETTVDNDISQQESAQQEVSMFTDGAYPPSVLSFR
jgi:hypothetical protein